MTFLRPFPYGVDSYYYYSIACGTNHAAEHESLLTQNFSWFPCSFLAVKIAIVLLGFAILTALWKIGLLFDPKKADLYAMLFLLNPVLVQMLSNFEDDLFGMVFFAWSLYFLVKSYRGGGFKEWGAALLLAGAGFAAWIGIAPWIIAVLLSFPIAIPAGVAAIAVTWEKFSLSINGLELEHQNKILGVLMQGLFLAVGVLGLPFWLFPGLLYTLVLAFLSVKYSVWFGVFLAVGACFFFERKKSFEGKSYAKKIASILPIVLLVPIILGAPSAENMAFVQHGVDLAHGRTIINDFSFGHYITALGGSAQKFGGPPQPDMNEESGIKMTNEDINCPVADRTTFAHFFEIKLYDCP